METAIPEYCPDIALIVDTVGQLRLREKHPAGQQLTMGGSVVLTVLYTSEESAGLRSLSMEVPFSCQVEDKRLMGCTAVCVAGRLLLAEARAVTARAAVCMRPGAVSGPVPRHGAALHRPGHRGQSSGPLTGLTGRPAASFRERLVVRAALHARIPNGKQHLLLIHQRRAHQRDERERRLRAADAPLG